MKVKLVNLLEQTVKTIVYFAKECRIIMLIVLQNVWVCIHVNRHEYVDDDREFEDTFGSPRHLTIVEWRLFIESSEEPFVDPIRCEDAQHSYWVQQWNAARKCHYNEDL